MKRRWRRRPNEYTSLAGETGSPRACSGLMYSGVPMTRPCCVASSASGPVEPGRGVSGESGARLTVAPCQSAAASAAPSPAAARTVGATALGGAGGPTTRGLGLPAVAHEPRQAEVEHLHLPVRGEHHVRRLQVAVDDARLVGRHEDAGHLLGDAHGATGPDSPSSSAASRPRPSDELQHEEVRPLALDVVVDLADVGVAKAGEDARLAEEPRPGLRVEPGPGADRLERHPPLERLVEADVDAPHAAAGEEPLDADVPDAPPDEVLVRHPRRRLPVRAAP